MNARLGITSVLCLLAIVVLSTASADFNVIPLPASAYLAQTTNIPFVGTDGDILNSITDGALTVSFSVPCTLATVPDTWNNWNSPPFVESATPRVLYSPALTLYTLDLSAPVKILGLEMEADVFGTFALDATFFNGVTAIGTIQQLVTTEFPVGGALLFAASTTTDSFDRIVLSAPPSAGDIGFAQVRYGLKPFAPGQVPEPGTCALLGMGLVGLAGWRRRKKQ